MRLLATLLMVLQALTPLAAWPQATRSTAPAPAAGSPSPQAVPARGPASDKRLALIVGNNTYKSAPLLNPINDARLVSETLKGLGFEVILRENLNLRDFKAVMRQFVTRLENEDGAALFYYAGHGVQVEGRNYLLPVDVGVGDEYEVRDESVDLEETLMSRLSKARKRERIIILDACRDNPFKQAKQASRGVGARGFAQMGSDEKGTLIVYSTSPGHTAEDGLGKNSVFTQFFAQEIQKEGIEVGQALRSVFNQVNTQTKGRQTPWYNSSLLGDFYFKAPNVRAEEERRRKEIAEKVDAALREQKRDEAARISAVLAEREKERERERAERERMFNAQIAEMKALLERRDSDLKQARVQVASSAKTRDEQVAILAQAEADRQRVERDRAAAPAPAAPSAPAAPAAPPPPSREQQEARKKAEADLAVKRLNEQQVREARDRFLKLEADRRTADERAEKEQADREARAGAELARREAQAAAELARREAQAAAELARREAAAKNRADKERLAQEQARDKDRLAQEQAKRKATDDARRAESARLANAASEKMRAFEEQAKTAAQERQVAESAPVLAQAPTPPPAPVVQAPAADPVKRVEERVKKAREDVERATREAETQQRLAKIEEDVSRKTQLEFEMLGKRSNIPVEIAALTINEPQKVVVPGTNGDFLVRGIRLPGDVAVRPAPANAPARCAEFLGAWGGGRWNGDRTAEIWVESIDADCRARAIYARGGLGMSGELPTYVRGEGMARGDTLSLDFGTARIELTKDGNGMAGRWSSGTGSASARFTKIPSQPDRSVSIFANETQDFGASPSRVIARNQISDRANLPLPMIVPSVDTLTTVQLDAFLKSHPDAVLVDAMVVAHRTLPGAYWMPELGTPDLGSLELDQISNTMRAATGGDRTRPVIVFERSSTWGWHGYHGVLRLIGMGYSNIYWYRGGIDAWFDAQFPTAQARSWARAG